MSEAVGPVSTAIGRGEGGTELVAEPVAVPSDGRPHHRRKRTSHGLILPCRRPMSTKAQRLETTSITRLRAPNAYQEIFFSSSLRGLSVSSWRLHDQHDPAAVTHLVASPREEDRRQYGEPAAAVGPDQGVDVIVDHLVGVGRGRVIPREPGVKDPIGTHDDLGCGVEARPGDRSSIAGSWG